MPDLDKHRYRFPKNDLELSLMETSYNDIFIYTKSDICFEITKTEGNKIRLTKREIIYHDITAKQLEEIKKKWEYKEIDLNRPGYPLILSFKDKDIPRYKFPDNHLGFKYLILREKNTDNSTVFSFYHEFGFGFIINKTENGYVII